ncbi:MAG: hypothetical protein MUP44_06680, partial [Anaerolineales bacterium]|nr:hypothetical protein [Anaerolineales bacterium]
MKRAVSISLGSSKRDKSVEVELLGVQVRIERIGTDGDMEKAAQLYRDLDGKVDAFGVGGADLALHTDDRVYPLHSVKPMVRYVKKTPLVDGSGLKETAEARLADFVDKEVGLGDRPRRVLLTGATSRWGMAMSFLEADYDELLHYVMQRKLKDKLGARSIFRLIESLRQFYKYLMI